MNPEQEKLHIYIDESSTLGIKQNEPYFIVCALVLSEAEKRPIKNAVKRILRKLSEKGNLDELHASEMSFSEKQFAHNRFQEKGFSLCYLVAHKESIHENLFKKKNVCFNYFVYLAIKDVLEKTHLKDIHITIDTRSVKVTSEKSLEEYLNTQLAQQGIYHKNVFVQYGDSKNYFHLQAVDLFSNALYARYNFGKEHFYSYISHKVLQKVLFPKGHFGKK
ncbi:MAG: DUF3800 domain-containing protein [Candidatus Paceibacterota bacterium]|jgi:hypothetical protein